MQKKRKALLIGVMDYNPSGSAGPDLRGPVNDVNDMKAALTVCGFKETEMLILLNRCATKSNILNGVSWLLSDNDEGDSLVLYFAGHGSYELKPTVNGNVREQVIRPHQFSDTISVEALDEQFARLKPGVHLEVFMDCCHSGPPNSARNLEALAEEGSMVRFIPPVNESSLQPQGTSNFESIERYFIYPEAIVAGEASHILWAACKINQQARERPFDQQIKGVFTYHLSSILRDGGSTIQRGELDSRLEAAMRRSVDNQTPQLRAKSNAVSQPIFM